VRLDELLAVWKVRRFGELVDVIEAAGRAAAATRGQRDGDDETYVAVCDARNPADVDWLIANVVVATDATSSIERVTRLTRWHHDPRIADGLLAIAERRTLTSRQSRPFWTIAFQRLARDAHARFAPAIARLLERPRPAEFDEYLHQKLSRLRERVERTPAPPAPTPEAAAAIAAIASALGIGLVAEAQRTADDFVRDIWAAPTDDGLREVFADWLIQHGDPRGELITLQIARRKRGIDAAGMRRERELLAEHARKWMGDLEPVIVAHDYRFEGGFLYACKVAWRKLAVRTDLMTHPAWSTVREYTLDPDGESACDAWLDHMIAVGAKRR
jgi:uncharacterized protein (TIGR02996 family)